MDLFQRLLGTLQRTVDYISTFTTYLLGDEAHPGAEAPGNTRETVPHRSCHECEVETAHYGDISPRDDLKASEGPPNAEEIQEASGKDFSSAQATEAIPRASKLLCKDEGQEDVRQKLSEPPDFLADAPKQRSSATGGIQQGDLEGPMVTGGLHQWEPEGSTRMGAAQQELLEEITGMKARRAEKPLAGGQEREELGRAGDAEGTWQKEQKETEGGEQEAPGGTESDGEEQRGLDGAAWTGGFQQQAAKMVEDLQSEPDGELVRGANTEDNQQEEPDIEVGDEGLQPALPDSAETGGDQQGGPGEAETRSHPQWEPDKKVTLEVQEEDPKGVTEEEGGQQRGLEGSETEGLQLGELEGFVRKEGIPQREQEGNEGDGEEESVVEEQRGDGTARTGRFQQEMARMVEDLRSEPDGQLPTGTNMEDNQLEESDIETGDEGAQPAVPDSVEFRGDWEGGPEGEAEARSHPHWEPEERVVLEVQEKNLKGDTEKGDSQQRGLEKAEMEAQLQGELEGFVRNEGTEGREHEENKRDEQKETGGEESVMAEQKREGTAWTGRSQQEADKMAERQWLEVEGRFSGGAEAENSQQGEPEMDTGDEGAQRSMLGGAEPRGDQEGGPEREAEARSSPHWEPEKTVTLEVQEEGPKGVTEKGGGQQRGLEEAEMEESQQREPEGFLRNEGTQRREQEENEGYEQEATCGEQPNGDGTAWTGRSQEEPAQMADGQWLEAEGRLEGGVMAENNQQREPDMETGDGGSWQSILDGAETGGDQQGGQEGGAEVGRNLQWEPEKTVTLEERPDSEEGSGQQQGPEGAEVREGHQHGKLEELVRNDAENEEEGQVERTGEPGLERDQLKDPEVLVVLEEEVEAAMMEEPAVQGLLPREGTERSLPYGPLGDRAPVDPCCLAGARAFPDEVPSLDTSAQKERVLLRRKSSIRRAPSVKRPRPAETKAMETPPPQETSMEASPPPLSPSPSQPPSSVRPNLRHAGFGPMHPNMMAELQMRLRRPQ
ncbi:UNVERIFIED_CONTAM: hypothetical protein K2H54_039645 [Gekko kuhli]